MILESEDIKLEKAKYEDWKDMYRNVWSHPETAKYMEWSVTTNEEEAKLRIKRTIHFEENHDTYLVYEKQCGTAIGFAGVEMIEPEIYQEAGIALGPEYVRKGYGTQILKLLLEYCKSMGGKEFYYYSRAENKASRRLALTCGFEFRTSERRIDSRNGESYEMLVYHKEV